MYNNYFKYFNYLELFVANHSILHKRVFSKHQKNQIKHPITVGTPTEIFSTTTMSSYLTETFTTLNENWEKKNEKSFKNLDSRPPDLSHFKPNFYQKEKSLCLPKMPPPLVPFAFSSFPDYEGNHQAPIWLALLSNKGKYRNKAHNAKSKHEKETYNVRSIDYNKGDTSQSKIDSSKEMEFSKEASSLKKKPFRQKRNSVNVVRYYNAKYNKNNSRLKRSPKFSILSSEDTTLSLSSVKQSPILSHKRQLQTIHPQSPNEKDWVMVAGNESAVDRVLSIRLLIFLCKIN